SLRSLCADWSLQSLRSTFAFIALKSSIALFSFRSLWSDWSLQSLRSTFAFIALKSSIALFSFRSLWSDWSLQSLRSTFAFIAFKSSIALFSFRSLWSDWSLQSLRSTFAFIAFSILNCLIKSFLKIFDSDDWYYFSVNFTDVFRYFEISVTFAWIDTIFVFPDFKIISIWCQIFKFVCG